MTVCSFVYLSNHCHLLLQPTDAWQLARFMNYVNANIAREAGRLYQWREKFWSRRYRAIVVSDEPEAELKRLRYQLSQGCKEGLVDSPRKWPGPTAARALGKSWTLSGLWFDRTAEFKARMRGENVPKMRFAESLELLLTPIPSWQELPDHCVETRLSKMIRDIEDETQHQLASRDDQAMGATAILEQHPHGRPRGSDRSPAPRFHAHRGYVRRSLELAYRRFLYNYREAARLLAKGKEVTFPPGAFQPSSRFVPV